MRRCDFHPHREGCRNRRAGLSLCVGCRSTWRLLERRALTEEGYRPLPGLLPHRMTMEAATEVLAATVQGRAVLALRGLVIAEEVDAVLAELAAEEGQGRAAA